MKKLYPKKQVGLTISCILALGVVSTAVNAESNQIPGQYVTDEWQNVFTNDYGECWHTGEPLPRADNWAPCKAGFAALEAPIPTAIVPVPEPLAMTFGVDSMFEFDKSELLPSGREKLDTFISKLSDMKSESITVIGHTDRLGSESYNQHLSEQRAQAVKSYIVSMGVPAETIHAFGKGETQPVTKIDDCSGDKVDLITCLQPNRRVETQVVGTSKE